MRHLILIFSILFFGILQGQVNSINEASFAIKSIDTSYEDFTDLQALKKIIGDSRIVFMGEASHDDGSTLQARTRLTKFLHQEMDFEVLAFEAGFYDAFICNEQLQDLSIPISTAKDHLMRGGWDNSKGSAEIFDYMRQSWDTGQPLQIAGFDVGRPPFGIQHYLDLLAYIFKQHPDLNYTAQDSILMSNLIHASCGYLGNEFKTKVSLQDYEKASYLLYDYIEKIAQKNNWEKPIDHLRTDELQTFFLQSLNMDIAIGQLSGGGLAWNLVRDKCMADRFQWLAKYLYPNKKIIVWAATGHLMNQNFEMEHSYMGYPNYQTSFLQMGDYLNYLGTKEGIYSIGFTTFKGERGTIYPPSYKYYKEMTNTRTVEPAPTDSYESYAHQLGHPYLFTDIKHQSNDSWLKGNIKLHIFETSYQGSMYKIFDGLFFIDQMEPIHKMPKKE